MKPSLVERDFYNETQSLIERDLYNETQSLVERDYIQALSKKSH